MARVTVEDCLKHVNNRFDLVLIASKRAHQLEMGAAEPLVPPEHHKPTVLALREIAAGYDVKNADLRVEVTGIMVLTKPPANIHDAYSATDE